MSNLLVIGGTGFFGKSILDAFRRKILEPWGITRVIVLSRNPEVLLDQNSELLSAHVELYTGDVSSLDSLPAADYVIHAAASTDSTKYSINPDLEINNIVDATLNYCKLAPIYHRDSKIVFCSSGAVYGYQAPDVHSLHEGMQLGSLNGLHVSKQAYAKGKRISEQLVIRLGIEQKLSVSIARCFSFVGRYLPRDQHFAVGNFLADILAGREIEVKARGPVYRSYMDADELVVWLMTLADNSNCSCPIYNVGSDEIVELQELSRRLASLFSKNLNSALIAGSEVDRYIPDVSRAKNDFGLTSKFNVLDFFYSSL